MRMITTDGNQPFRVAVVRGRPYSLDGDVPGKVIASTGAPVGAEEPSDRFLVTYL